MYINVNDNDCHHQRITFICLYVKKAKNVKGFYCKKQDNFRYAFKHKKQNTLHYAIFNENFLSWHLHTKIIKLFVTWRFYMKKARHLARIKTICVAFLYTRIRTFFVTQFFIAFLILVEGGEKFYMQKLIHFALPQV